MSTPRVMVDAATILAVAAQRAKPGPADENQYDEQARTLHELGFRIVGRDDTAVQLREREYRLEQQLRGRDAELAAIAKRHVPGPEGHCVECGREGYCWTYLTASPEVPF